MGLSVVARIAGNDEWLTAGEAWAKGVLSAAVGLLAQTMGQLDAAAVHFEDALAFCRRAGYRPELVWSCPKVIPCACFTMD